MVSIAKGDWKYLGMCLGKEMFIDRCLSMRASSSCAIFQRICEGLAWITKAFVPSNCMVFNCLDDFLFLDRNQADCELALNTFVNICEDVGVPISAKKTVKPCTSLTFLGIGIGAVEKALFIPPEKAGVA